MRMSAWLSCAAALAASLSCSQPPGVDPATLVLIGGKVVTVDDRQPEAEAIAVRGDSIVAVGTNAEIQAYIDQTTEVIELAGQLAIPGFIESHGHFMGLGQSRTSLDLLGVKDFDEIVSMVEVAAKQARPGEWIQGRGWHQEKWASVPEPNVEGFPVHGRLSSASPDNPVLLTHASGHATFVNQKAMELANITARTPNPPGGEILKDDRGRPTGVLRETASNLARRALSEWQAGRTAEERTAELRRQIELANEESLANGVTTFHDAGSSFETIDLFKQMAAEGKLGVRLWVMVRESNETLRAKLPQYRAHGLYDRRLTIAAIKVTSDGALGSRGAWLLEPYSDSPGSTGLSTVPIDSIRETAKIAMDHDVQLAVHAIGDRANREVLDLFEEAYRATPDRSDPRWRIEHAQHLHPADIPRFGRLGVIASMQGVHCTSDAPYVPQRLGPRRSEEGAYVWQKLMQAGAVISNGTDVPVERIDPLANFFSTVTRRTADGTVFHGDQRMSRADALRSSTLNGAHAGKEEALKGSLTPGKLADITVLSKDILTVPEDEITTARVVYTIVGGKVVYKGH